MLVEEQNNTFLSDHFLHCSYYSGQLACEVGGGGLLFDRSRCVYTRLMDY